MVKKSVYLILICYIAIVMITHNIFNFNNKTVTLLYAIFLILAMVSKFFLYIKEESDNTSE
ncbi:hypothetical protein JOE23_001905 [Amphibacillus cookii]|nr:hypothetical protein [Amphibacillus cookii]